MTWFVFDFDGVLFDTARECLAVAYETARRTRDRRPQFAPLRDNTPPAELASTFLAHRRWVGPPWQYAVLIECILANDLPASTADFLVRATARRPALEGFTDDYFATRRQLAEDTERWTSVIAPYEEAVRCFAALHARGRAAVLSTRDDVSIRRLLEHFIGLEIGDALLPRSGPLEKWQILDDAARTRRLPARRVFFLDDYLAHARPAHERGFAAHLATWGYLAADDLHDAQVAGLPCLTLAELERTVAAHEREDAHDSDAHHR